ncbi:erythromycin esterase family protein [Streptomyces sp. NPDC051567]|uniref:erythromycin esterase family protein n=1 Tax=Streptomyces sp. NPDC051567 TaxID=3365660 RepID=UPI00379AB760
MRSDDSPAMRDAQDSAPPRPSRPSRRSRRLLLAVPLMLCLAATTGVGTALADGPRSGDPVSALSRAAHPLRSTAPDAPDDADLRPLGRMIAGADVVGVGEATHGSGEFVTTKHRLFRHLVEEKGFTTFAFEIHWSAGVRLDDWVRYGRGDLSTIMDEEFQNGGRLWNTEEMADLFRWMRAWNTRHDRPLRIVGDDLTHAGPVLFDRVTSYVGRHDPELRPEIERLYRESRPTAGVDETMKARRAMPRADRQRLRDDARAALVLLESRAPGPDAREHALVLQHARAIAQNATLDAFDLVNDVPAALRYRDEMMAANTAWWQRHTGGRVFLSAHNTHVAGETSAPAYQPKTQGEFLREELGRRYVNIGFTFGRGSFNAIRLGDPDMVFQPFSVGAPEADSSERTLEQVSRHDYYLDTRAAPPAARDWLRTVHRTRNIGASWPLEAYEPTRLAQSYDILIHLHRITATHMR